MSNTNNKGPYYKLLDLLSQHKSKLTAMKAEIETLDRENNKLRSEALDAFNALNENACDFQQKEEAIHDNLIAIRAMRLEIGYQEKAIAKTEERVKEEAKKKPGRIRD